MNWNVRPGLNEKMRPLSSLYLFLLRNDIFFAPALIYTVKHLSFEISPKTIFYRYWKALKIVLDFKIFVPLYFSQWARG